MLFVEKEIESGYSFLFFLNLKYREKSFTKKCTTFVHRREQSNEKELLFNSKTKEMNHMYAIVTNTFVVHQWKHLNKWTHTYTYKVLPLFFFSLVSLLVTTNWKKKSQDWISKWMCVRSVQSKKTAFISWLLLQDKVKFKLNMSKLKRNRRKVLHLLNFLFPLLFHSPSPSIPSYTVHNQLFSMSRKLYDSILHIDFYKYGTHFPTHLYMTYLLSKSNKT